MKILVVGSWQKRKSRHTFVMLKNLVDFLLNMDMNSFLVRAAVYTNI